MEDDYTMGDVFRDHRAVQQKKRADNREFSTAELTRQGVPFTAHNDGAHLIVAGKWNFWPGTGKWDERKGRAGFPKRQGRGVFRLRAIIKEE